MDIVISKYQQEDFDGVAEGLRDLHNTMAEMDELKRIKHLTIDEGKMLLLKMLETIDMQNEPIFLVAKQEDAIVGFVQGYINRPKSADSTSSHFTHQQPKTDGWIEEIWVDQSQRGKGTAKLLADAIMTYFKERDCDAAQLRVLDANVHARHFYEKLGFKPRVVEYILSL